MPSAIVRAKKGGTMSKLLAASRFGKVEQSTESNEKESYLHSGLSVAAYACLVHLGAANQKEWLSEAVLNTAEAEGLGKDEKLTAAVFQSMKHWLLNSKVGRAGGNKANLKELAEAEAIYLGAAKPKAKAKAKATVKAAVKAEAEAEAKAPVAKVA